MAKKNSPRANTGRKNLAQDIARLAKENKDMLLNMKIAFTRAEAIIQRKELTPEIVWLSVLNGLALNQGGHDELMRNLLATNHEPAEIFTWYFSARFAAKEVFQYAEAAGLNDGEIIHALINCDVWNGESYKAMDGFDIFTSILTSGWEYPRQIAALIKNDLLTLRYKDPVYYLLNQFGDQWLIEMIAQSGCFSPKAFDLVKALKAVDARVENWNEHRLWQTWTKFDDLQKTALLVQAMPIRELLRFLRSKKKSEIQIITDLLQLGVPLGVIAIKGYILKRQKHQEAQPKQLSEAEARSIKKVIEPDGIERKWSLEEIIQNMLIEFDPRLITALEEMGKKDGEIVTMFLDSDFTYELTARALGSVGWKPQRALIAMIDAGCAVALISKMIHNGEADFRVDKNSFWTREIVYDWRRALQEVMQETADHSIFGQDPEPPKEEG